MVITWKTELKTLEWDILNPDRLINLEIKNKSGSSIILDIHHSKVPSSGYFQSWVLKELVHF